MKILKLSVGDRVEMKKIHPCGGKIFRIMRVGSEIRAICENCRHDMTIDRIKFEKSVKKFIDKESEENTNE